MTSILKDLIKNWDPIEIYLELSSRGLCNISKFNFISSMKLQKAIENKDEFAIAMAIEDAELIEECFKNFHNTKTAKQTVRKLLTDWSNFKKAIRVYKADKSKFKRFPKPPGYKQKMAQVIFYNKTIKKKEAKKGNIIPINIRKALG